MRTLNQALLELVDALEEADIPYMIIGGLAALRWAEPRATVDVDAVVWVEDDDRDAVIDRLSQTFDLRPMHSPEFFERTRVLLLRTAAGIDLDVLFALLPYEWEAIQRSVDVEVEGKTVKFCAPEDLILYKVLSRRPRDREDIRQVLRHQKAKLDFEYLEPRIKGLAELTERPEILDFWNAVKRESGRTDPDTATPES